MHKNIRVKLGDAFAVNQSGSAGIGFKNQRQIGAARNCLSTGMARSGPMEQLGRWHPAAPKPVTMSS